MKRASFCVFAVICNIALADPIWHCSRTKQDGNETSALNSQENEFSIASFNASADTIGVSISDLIDIYSGISVRVGNLPLSACFIPGNQKTTTVALTSLGLQPSVIQALAQKSAIIQSNLHPVTNNSQMVACIAQNYPAVGYLQEATSTDKIQPCF